MQEEREGLTPLRPGRTVRAGRAARLAVPLLLAAACTPAAPEGGAAPSASPAEEPLVALAEAVDMPEPPSLRAEEAGVTAEAVVASWTADGGDASIPPPAELEWTRVPSGGLKRLAVDAPAEPGWVELRASAAIGQGGIPDEGTQQVLTCDRLPPDGEGGGGTGCTYRFAEGSVLIETAEDGVAGGRYVIVYAEWPVVDSADPAGGVHDNSASWALEVA